MPVDARVQSDVVDLVRRCEELGELELVVHNIGANVRFAAHETTERVFRKVWELACLSAFLVGREGSKPMAQRGRGIRLVVVVVPEGVQAGHGGLARLRLARGGPGFVRLRPARLGPARNGAEWGGFR